MKKLILVLLIAVSLVPALAARDIAPVVDAAWLEANLADPRLLVLDMRKADEYKAGHIPGAVNVLGAAVYVAKNGLNNEVPETDDLTDLFQSVGVKADSLIVVVESDGGRLAWATRVAWTLVYAGLENVAVLDGGYKAWTAAGKKTDTTVAKRSGTYEVKALVPGIFADKAYVVSNALKLQMVDARTYDTYFGLSKQGFVAQAGHVQGAYPLPYTWITDANGMMKPAAELAAAAARLGLNSELETLVYCDSGVLATTWWWVMSQMLGWKNVRSFDGSSQALAADPAVKFQTQVWR